MELIGREREIGELTRCLRIDRPQFVAVYGRRRVGKTFLVKEFFRSRFSFYATGLARQKLKGQLRAFHDSLLASGDSDKTVPADWFEAFSRLRACLSMENVYREPTSGKRVVFLDELPWMDTPRADFRSALDYFWNSWGSAQEDLLLIVCGSATSWMIAHLLDDHGGFHNRITKRIHLMPFSLRECEKLLTHNGVQLPRNQIIEYYMVFGGIPYYLNLMDERFSLVQNVEELCFRPYGDLYNEYDNLLRSLFKKPEKHMAILKALSGTKNGLTRKKLSENPAVGGGSMLTKDLQELEQSGFIRKYTCCSEVNEVVYQIIDPFTLFALTFLQDRKTVSWQLFYQSPAYYFWRGNAFENTCLCHIPQIKAALGIAAVSTSEYGWRSSSSEGRAQIDLLIDRADGLINLCEMKFTDDPYVVTKEAYEQLLHRLSVFRQEAKPKKAVHITLISANGVQPGKYINVAQNILDGDALFGT